MEHLSEGGAGPRKEFQITQKLMSPKGDLGTLSEQVLVHAFRRKMKASGRVLASSKAIPWREARPMEGDKGSGVREAPKDKVV